MGVNATTKPAAPPQRAPVQGTTRNQPSSKSLGWRDAACSEASSIHHLQRAVGNRAMNSLLRSRTIQPKLTVSHPEDESEREADRVADEVMRMPEPTSQPPEVHNPGPILRTCSECEDELQLKADLQRKESTPASSSNVSGTVEQTLNSSGRPLDHITRSFMEQRFGQDFGRVRVHTDDRAVDSARSVNALAYTVGSHIVFGQTQYAPHTTAGRRLLAHELTHVVQQNPGTSNTHANQTIATSSNHSVVLARLPAPADCHTRLKGLSPIGPIVKENYEGNASTTIDDTIWPLGSWERRWQIYDGTDALLWESFYTFPKPTLTIPKELVVGGTAGGDQHPWSVWIKVTKTMVPFGGDDAENFPHDYITFPVYETQEEFAAAHQAKSQAKADDDSSFRVPGIMPEPTPAGVMTPSGTKVTPEIALELIKNMNAGNPPFKPELGKGGCSWFVSEGNPYPGKLAGKTVAIQAEVARPAEPLIFDEAKLKAINDKIKTEFEPSAEAKYRQHKGIPPEQPLNAKQRSGLEFYKREAVESLMWDEVGKQVRESATKVGEVILQNSEFSKSGNGKFLVVADASKIQIKGGISSVVSALEKAGTPVEPVVTEAAEAMAKRMKWVGRVKNVFRYGGRVLIVVAIAADVYKVYTAQDKTKAVITSLGGWVGATAAGAAFAAWWTPADVAGPWAWVGHGVGTLVAGGVGYWIGSETVRTIYELVLEE